MYSMPMAGEFTLVHVTLHMSTLCTMYIIKKNNLWKARQIKIGLNHGERMDAWQRKSLSLILPREVWFIFFSSLFLSLSLPISILQPTPPFKIHNDLFCQACQEKIAKQCSCLCPFFSSLIMIYDQENKNNLIYDLYLKRGLKDNRDYLLSSINIYLI